MNTVRKADKPARVPTATPEPQRKLKVVIVDDNLDCLELYETFFDQAVYAGRFQIQKFTNGDEAWAKLSEVDPDLLITDMLHPGLDGFRMLTCLAAKKVAYPILLITGSSFTEFYKNKCPALNLTVIQKGNLDGLSKHLSLMAEG